MLNVVGAFLGTVGPPSYSPPTASTLWKRPSPNKSGVSEPTPIGRDKLSPPPKVGVMTSHTS